LKKLDSIRSPPLVEVEPQERPELLQADTARPARRWSGRPTGPAESPGRQGLV